MSSTDRPKPRARAARGDMVGPGRQKKCCRSTPRCRSCPVTLAAEIREVRALGSRDLQVPAHLAGVPECLHKYEPLLRQSWEKRTAEERAAKERAAWEHAVREPLNLPRAADRDEVD
jgi:hypothetical protein